MSNNKDKLTEEDLKPFINHIFKNNTINISELLYYTPLIPSFYFLRKVYSDSDNISDNDKQAKIIDAYYKIKNDMNYLEQIKDTILSILELCQEKFNKILIDNNNYGINNKKLIINLTGNLNKDFKYYYENGKNFKIFKNKFIDEKCNFYKNINNLQPLFFSIFQSEYTDKDKDFFFKLFNEYIFIRNQLVLYIQNNWYGILAFSYMFELNNNLGMKQKINNEKNKIINESSSQNNKNENYHFNNNSFESNNNSNKKINIIEKIGLYDTLYINDIDKSFYITEYKKNINNSFSFIYNSINQLSNNNNLYDVMVHLLNLDFYGFQFIFNYVEDKLFINSINIHYKIKKYILNKIVTFQNNYYLYKEWYKKLKNIYEEFDMENNNNQFKVESFRHIYKKLLKSEFKNYL
jgi:hypothetical protein